MPHADASTLRRRIAVARGQQPADLLFTNVRLVNVLSGDIHETCVSVVDGMVAGFEPVEAATVVDGQGRYLCPGFIDGHLHIESSLLTPPRFAAAAAARGTAAVVCDPHEIANVLGPAGIEYMLAASQDLPLSVYVMMPSCVPATHLETSGAVLDAGHVADFLARYPQRMPGLAEMMNFPGVLFGDEGVLAKLLAAQGKVVDGHAPTLSGADLSAYALAGPGSDHECISAAEATEKLRKGLHVFLREGTHEHNLADLLAAVTPYNCCRCCLVSDDRLAGDLLDNGHLDAILRKAVALGLDPLRAVQMVTINPARYFGLDRLPAGAWGGPRRGAIAPGWRADMLLLDDLRDFHVSGVFLAGQPLESLLAAGAFDSPVPPPGNSMRLGPLDATSFRIPARPGRLRVIEVLPGQIVTAEQRLDPSVDSGNAVADPARDLAKLAVIERHTASGRLGLGFVTGLGFTAGQGALACTVAHDSHNLIVAGMDDADMLLAARTVQALGGGLAVVSGGTVLATLALPVAGLMADAPAAQVAAGLARVNDAARSVAGRLPEPFAALSFLALPVIPALKLTDKGLVDVASFQFVELFS